MNKEHILDLIAAFVNERPHLEKANYAHDWRDADGIRAYNKDRQGLVRDMNDAHALIAQCRWREIPLATMQAALTGGRLTLTSKGLAYCAGQYYPLEYREACCAVLARMLRSYWLDNGVSDIRAHAKRELGRALASRYF